MIMKKRISQSESTRKNVSKEILDGYIKTLKKYKSGGYYTFNSKDVEQYVNYYLSQKSINYGKINKSDFHQQSLELF